MTDQDRIKMVAAAFCELDGHEPQGPRLGAAICDAVRFVMAFDLLERMREPPPAPSRPSRRSRASQPVATEH